MFLGEVGRGCCRFPESVDLVSLRLSGAASVSAMGRDLEAGHTRFMDVATFTL